MCGCQLVFRVRDGFLRSALPLNLFVKLMSRAVLDLAVERAASEGCNPGRRYAANFHVADPSGFLMGFVDDQPVACISVVRYGDGYGFLGFYIVAREWRGRGHGIDRKSVV